jgi:putative N6-adenine-specific DNA methylase
MSTLPPGAGRDEALVAKTLFGLEGVLADELRMLGAKEVKTVPRAVTFVGDLGFIYKCNLMLTTALKVLRPIHQFGVLSKEDLYRGSLEVPWTDWFSPNSTFVVRCSGQHPAFTHSGFAALVVKDAIADSFRKIHGIRPSVGKENPDIVIDVRLTPNRAHLSMDSSGHSLHRRGYRQEVGAAPMSEVLAAGILRLAGYRGDMPLLDPMCGSGTFPIEAAIQADRLPPGLFRDRFAFQSWSDYSEDLHAKIEESVLKKGRESLAPIFGWDREAYMLVKAQKNAEAATMEDRIQWKRQTFIGSEKPTERGLMLVNPPYNVKIQADTDALYRGMAETMAKSYAGWEAWILSADREALRRAGWDIFKRIPLKNGDLDCDLVGVRLG